MVIVLDTFPTSSVAKRLGKTPTVSDQCRDWIAACEAANHTILVPALCYYEVLGELEQRQAISQITSLTAFCLLSTRFLPLSTAHLETAARLWGDARRLGLPTASKDALDGDVILAAQALSLGLPTSDYIVATTNPGHLPALFRVTCGRTSPPDFTPDSDDHDRCHYRNAARRVAYRQRVGDMRPKDSLRKLQS